MSTSVIFDLVDADTALAKDACDGASRDIEFENFVRFLLEFESLEQLGFCSSNALLATLNENFISLELLPGLTLPVLSGRTREGDLDIVRLLQSDGVLATLTNERGVVLAGDF